MLLTEDNYYSQFANETYFSASFYKDMCKCEAAAMARLSGAWNPRVTEALLLGSYLDSWMDGTLPKFREEHPEIFTKSGMLKAEYKRADDAIAKISSDVRFMQYIGGEHQKILTWEMFGVPWKAKLDSFHEGVCIVDLKYVRSYDSLRIYRYDIQGAVYQASVKACGLGELPFYLAAVTKESIPDCDIFQVTQPRIDMALSEIEKNMQHFIEVKRGIVSPKRCGRCDYCKTTKKAAIRNFEELFF